MRQIISAIRVTQTNRLQFRDVRGAEHDFVPRFTMSLIPLQQVIRVVAERAANAWPGTEQRVGAVREHVASAIEYGVDPWLLLEAHP